MIDPQKCDWIPDQWQSFAGYDSYTVPFETKCVGAVHRALFKDYPFKKVVEFYKKECGDAFVQWDWYSSRFVVDAAWPSITFDEKIQVWNLTLSDLLATASLPRMGLYKEWQKSGCEVLVVPLVGKKMVFFPGCIPESGDFIVKRYKDVNYILMTLTDWLHTLGEPRIAIEAVDNYFSD